MNDKLKHLLAGFIISLLFILLSQNIVVGLIAAFIIGAAKEIWDYFGHGTSDKEDLLATVQGGVIGCLLLMFLKVLE